MSLFLLQNCDQSIQVLQTQITQNDAVIHNRIQEDAIRTSISEKQTELDHLNTELLKIEDKISSNRIKSQQSNSSLYSGKIHNPKELQELEIEIKLINQTLAQLEEQQLDVMINIETETTVLNELESSLNAHLADKKLIESRLAAENLLHQTELQKIFTERDALVSSIDLISIEKYEKLRSTKAGVAVTRVDDNTCEKCGAEITQAVWQKARISSELCFCDTCGRIIYAR